MPSNENFSMKIWKAIKPMVEKTVQSLTRSCMKTKIMVVSTAYNPQTKTVGVQEALGKEIFLHTSGLVSNGSLVKGVPVWVACPFGSMSNAFVFMMGDGTANFIKTNQNLLDNWYFVDPINQRGENTWNNKSWVYTIDRWITAGRECELIDGQGIKKSGANFIQRILYKDLPPKGTTCCFSLLSNNGKLGSVVYRIGENTNIRIENGFAVFVDVGEFAQVGFYPFDGYVYQACKLEIGDQQTLAHIENGKWVLNETPNKALELVKCRRYYQRMTGKDVNAAWSFFANGVISSNTEANFNLIHEPMRLFNATVSFSGNFRMAGGDWGNVTNLRAIGLSVTSTTIRIDGTINVVNKNGLAVILQANNDVNAYIELSADL